ncbi:MAG: N-acetylmuramoyl-L-alanine amidase [Clostridiales bacterium]|nr:N-acetylmuramoyl-L-alanine amidase [Clostridiales bacterium]
MKKNDRNPNSQDPRNGKNNGNANQEDILSGIRRVSADSKVSDLSHERQSATSAQPKNRPAAPKDEAKHAAPNQASRPKTQNPQQRAQGTRPAVRRVPARQSKEEIKRRKRNAAIFLSAMFLLVLLIIGGGIYLLVKHLNSGDNKVPATSVTTTTTVETTQTSPDETTTEETTTSEITTTTESTATPTPQTTPFPVGGPDLQGYCVVIDAGHQEVANLSQEAMADGMSGSKAKSAEGFTGVISGINESEINLSVELLLKAYLESLGCEVYVTRETNDVDISNKERALMAVSHDPDLYIRLFCNAANDSASKGCEVIVPASGKYASEVSAWGENLGKSIAACTGGSFNGCKQSGNYSGLNWASDVPSFMIRMGYLSNSDEESLLLKEEYQFTICEGIAQFISTMPKK